jgi:GAF domain-containing protein
MQDKLSLLNRISDELNKDLHPDRMLRRVLDLTVAHLNATTGSIMLFDQQKRVLPVGFLIAARVALFLILIKITGGLSMMTNPTMCAQ